MHNVSKLDSSSLKLKDEEDEEDKEKEDILEKEKAKKDRIEKEKLSLEKEEAESKKKKRRLEKKKRELEEAEKEKGEEIEKEKGKEAESEIELEKEQEKEKGKKAEIETEVPQDKKDFVDLGKSREAMLNKLEKDLIKEHNRELDEAIKPDKAVVAHTQSLIKSMEKVKNVNERRLATLKVKATPYISTSEKPKRVQHTAGRDRVYGRKPPLHPSAKRSENPAKTSPAQNLRSSKRIRTESKPQ
ncbi:hypothetical protein JCGZ_09344 [Jatropha curcas]|uniref:Uncharacterized protein n=1 Tax=Jatropha curcas TaxID=180498 RepID=A0A067KXB7_JATCU|nr:hypothetical protein JCGZ_09344 [Jatropha curcas]